MEKRKQNHMIEFEPKSLLDKEFQIFIGRIGSGKTEISINFAMKLKEEGYKVILFDMDIVKPYIRIRDVMGELKKYNLEIVSPPEATRAIDLPIFPKFIIGRLMNKDGYKILDVGGDPYGAGSIAQFRDVVKEGLYNLFFIVNTRRPETSNVAEIIRAISMIQGASRMKVTRLVFNTNLRWETTKDIIMEGLNVVKEVSLEIHIPVAFGCVDESGMGALDSIDIPILPLKLFINPLPLTGIKNI
jgi:hypothetical protein